MQIGSAVPTGAAQVCGVVGVMQVAAGPPSELVPLPLPLPVAPVLAPDCAPDAPDEAPVAAPEGAPLLVPADAPDAPPEADPVEPPLETPEEAPLSEPDPIDPLELAVPEGEGEHAATNDTAATKPDDSQVLMGLISKLSQANLRDGAHSSLLARAQPRIR
jgi:hypothetical protein